MQSESKKVNLSHVPVLPANMSKEELAEATKALELQKTKEGLVTVSRKGPAPQPETEIPPPVPARAPQKPVVSEIPPPVPARARGRIEKADTVRKLLLPDPSYEAKIKHFWYRDWPDHDAPNLDDSDENSRFILFIDMLIEDMMTNPGT